MKALGKLTAAVPFFTWCQLPYRRCELFCPASVWDGTKPPWGLWGMRITHRAVPLWHEMQILAHVLAVPRVVQWSRSSSHLPSSNYLRSVYRYAGSGSGTQNYQTLLVRAWQTPLSLATMTTFKRLSSNTKCALEGRLTLTLCHSFVLSCLLVYGF